MTGTGLVAALAGGWLYFGDRAFCGVAKVGLAMSPVPGAQAGGQGRHQLPAVVVYNESEVIRSEAVLARAQAAVAGASAGAASPSRRAAATEAWRDRIQLVPREEARQIEIQVWDAESGSQAAAAARAIAVAYREHRLEHRWPAALPGPGWIRQPLASAEEEVARLRREVDKMARALHLTGMAAGTGAMPPGAGMEALRRATVERIEIQTQLGRLQPVLAKLKAMGREDLLKEILVLEPDPIFNELNRAVVAAEAKLTEARRRVAGAPDEATKAAAALAGAQTALDHRATDLVAAREAGVRELESALQKKTREIEQIRKEDVDRGGKNAPYWELKWRLEDAVKVRDGVAAKAGAASRLEVEIEVAPLLPTARIPRHPLAARCAVGAGVVLLLLGGGFWLPPRGPRSGGGRPGAWDGEAARGLTQRRRDAKIELNSPLLAPWRFASLRCIPTMGVSDPVPVVGEVT